MLLMRKNTLYFGLSSIITLILFWVLSTPLGPAPPLGPFMNPNAGFWANAETDYNNDLEFQVNDEALSDSIRVYFDDKQIPHIFAANDNDLYFAQGYITARDRLWQMELQTHAAAGRLSEILGPQMLDYDRYRRRIGMGYAAEQALEGMLLDEQTFSAIESYAAGVNAWIDQLDPAEYPIEYKILDYAPEEWTPVKSALLLKYMTYMLAGNNGDLRMSNTKAFFGDSFIKNILDLDPNWNDPTIPSSKEWDFEADLPPKPNDSFIPSIVEDILPFQPDPANGSNNWAVSGSKTASGYPILANDPHLNMTLPSIWYAAQLNSPSQNVMGVSLPGVPTIIVGFNEDIAWGTTNVGADVWDWYEIEFRDSTLSEYKHDGVWKETEKRIEKINIKGGETVIDTVIYTHHGPVVQDSENEVGSSNVPKYHAMRWIAYEPSNETRYFLEINKAKNYKDYRNALQHYDNPAQNWVFADSSDIAITVTGQYPKKWNEQGRYISDGSNAAYDWQGWIPFEQIPYIKNPERGFVSSANQDPTDSSYPHYLDDDFGPFERGRRINEQLASMDNITAQDMQNLQLDTYSYHAAKVLPTMMEMLNTDTLSEWHQQAYEELQNWNYENNGDLIAPSIFKYWWDELYSAIWSDEYQYADIPLDWPARDQVAWLVVNQPDLKWYDNITTDSKETLQDLVNNSSHKAMSKLTKEFGSYGDNWKWGYVNETTIGHLGQIPGFGKPLFTDGGAESINAIRDSHGPSWRMVVELGPEIKARAIYPGGQSGNPGSKYYANMAVDWNNGKLYPLWFMKNEPVASDSTNYSIIIK
ncbi:MAG: penicillin acylase family protein [Balneolaceae bacterium]|nr:penicillin acylase family protein [Balneolaceae bacterium]